MSLIFKQIEDGSWVGYRIDNVKSGEFHKNDFSPDYNNLSDEELIELAQERGIETFGLTRRKIINALKKVN
jgi:hypothetical protein